MKSVSISVVPELRVPLLAQDEQHQNSDLFGKLKNDNGVFSYYRSRGVGYSYSNFPICRGLFCQHTKLNNTAVFLKKREQNKEKAGYSTGKNTASDTMSEQNKEKASDSTGKDTASDTRKAFLKNADFFKHLFKGDIPLFTPIKPADVEQKNSKINVGKPPNVSRSSR